MQPLEVFTNRLNFPKNVFSLSQNIGKRTLLEQNTRGGGKGIENVISPFPPPLLTNLPT